MEIVSGGLFNYSKDEFGIETQRLFQKLKDVGWTESDCEIIAPITLEINFIKEEKNAIILAHSYQTPDIIFGVSDFAGDSLGLSVEAQKTDADIIIFSGVVFMAETAKILSPEKTVIVPSVLAGCSLADSITAEDVRTLKKRYPGIPIVCYVNSTAEVKAESNVCVTSANVEAIVSRLDSDQIIFIPDINMGKYLQRIMPEKEIILYEGTCVVHDNISKESIFETRNMHTELIVLAHSECPPDVLDNVDMVGGTTDMIKYIREHPKQKKYMIASECGLADRLSVDFPDRSFLGTCVLCPYMKYNELRNILQALKNPEPSQIVEVKEDIRLKAKVSLDKMLEYT